VRNLTSRPLIAFSPAFLLIYYGLLTPRPEFGACGLCVAVRRQCGGLGPAAVDVPLMVRGRCWRPNLSASGLTFTGISCWSFLMANVITNSAGAVGASVGQAEAPALPDPGYPLFDTFFPTSSKSVD